MRIRTTALVFAALVCGAVPARAALTPQPASLSFPDTGTGSTSAAQQLTFTNTGNASVIVNTITLTGPNPGDFAVANVPGLPVSIPPGIGFTVDVTFSPSTIGQRNAFVTATVNMMPNVDVPVSGKGIGPTASVMPSPITVGGLPFGQQQPPLTVTVSNSGGAQLHVSSVTLSGPDAARFTMTGLPGFPKTLGPGQSFAFTITYNPAQAGKASATLTVVSDDPMNPNLATPVSGLAGSPIISLDVNSIFFGNMRVNQSTQPVTVNITNTGFSALHVNSITVQGANAADFSLGNLPMLPATVAIGSSIKFTVAFTPSAAGARSGQVVIANDDPNAPMKALPLSGTGTLPMAAVSPNMLDFGQVKVGTTGGSNFTITNTGTGPVVIQTVTISGKDAALFTAAKQAPFTVAAMSSAVVGVSFKPTAIGMFSATLNLTTDDKNLPAVAIPMTGAGASAVFTANPLALDFGSIMIGDSAATQTVTLSNTGNLPLTVTSFLVTGGDSGDFPIGNQPVAPFTIAVGKSLTFDVGFKPSIDGGEHALITMMTDDPGHATAVINMDGFGTQPGISVAPPSLTFDAIDVGATGGPKQVTVQNIGDSDLHISAVTLSGAGAGAFSADPMGAMTVAANKAYKINVSFTPKSAGMFMATLEIDSSDAGIMPSIVMLSGSAVSPNISASPVMFDFGPIPVGMTAMPQQVMIRNGGIKTVVLDKITSTDPQFGPPIDNLSLPITPNSSIMLPIAFAPTAAGDFTAQVQFWLTNATVPAAAVTVKGTGVDASANMRGGGGCALGGRAAAPSLAVLLGLLGLAALLKRRR